MRQFWNWQCWHVIPLSPTRRWPTRWLDQQVALQHVPMTEVVRQAVQALRAVRQQSGEDFQALLAGTAGMWQRGDGLAWQQNVRDEWAR